MSVSYTLLNNSSQRIKYQWAVWKVIFWMRFQMQIDAFHTVLSFGEFLCPRFWHRTNIVDMVLLSHVICYGWSACFCRRILPIYLCWSAAAGRFHFQNDCYSVCNCCDELITSDFQWRCIMLVNKYKKVLVTVCCITGSWRSWFYLCVGVWKRRQQVRLVQLWRLR